MKLPEPVIVEGRMLYTKTALREYGRSCYEAGLVHEEPYISSHEPQSDSGSVDELMNLFGMKR